MLREAHRNAIIDAMEHRDEIAEHHDAPAVSLVGKAIALAGKLGNGVVKSEKVLEAGQKIVAVIGKIFE